MRQAETVAPPSQLPAPSEKLVPTPAPESDVVMDEGIYSDGDVVLGEGEYIVGPHGMAVSDGGCDGIGCAGCDACGDPYGWRKCFCIWFPSDGWVRGEYLSAFLTGVSTPPLVTTSSQGTLRSAAGVLGRETTSILYGGEELLTDQRGGFRLRFGTYFDPRHRVGLQAEVFNFESQSANFSETSSGDPILARPFFNMLTGAEDSELVAFPNVASGTVSVDHTQTFKGAGFHVRHLLCGNEPCPADWINLALGPNQRLDGIVGYRYLQLGEDLQVMEDLISTDPTDPGRFVIRDAFNATSQFNGVDVGVVYTGRRNQWTLEVLYRMAIGNTRQTVDINGRTSTTVGAVEESYTGGLLAQRSNIGMYSQDSFAVVPELGLTLGYQITPRWELMFGYTFLYWTDVVRAAEQISLDVNPNLLPPESQPFTGPLRPSFDMRTANLLMQAVSVGAEWRW
jgi:hypothetical protein